MKTKKFEFQPEYIQVDLDLRVHGTEPTEGDWSNEVGWTAYGTLTMDHDRKIVFRHNNGKYLNWNSMHSLDNGQKEYIIGVFKSFESAALQPAIEWARQAAMKSFEEAVSTAASYIRE